MVRVEDIETLCKLRNYNLKGYRNMILHCYAYWKGIYIKNIEDLENEVIELNNSFIDPLKETEIRAVLRCIPKAIDKFEKSLMWYIISNGRYEILLNVGIENMTSTGKEDVSLDEIIRNVNLNNDSYRMVAIE